MTLSRTLFVAFLPFLPPSNAVNFISINGARRPGAPWSVSWKGLRGDPENFFLCLGYSGPNAFSLSSDFRPFNGNYNCSSSRVSTAAGAARFNLPEIESDYYCFFASNSTANPMDFSNIFGQSDPFLLLMESNSGDQNSLSTDFISPSLVTSGVGKDVPDPFPTAGDTVTLTNGAPSTPETSVLSTLGSQTVVASTEASTPISTAIPPTNTATIRIVAGTISGGVAVALLVFFILCYRWLRRQKAVKKETQPTPYPAEVEANGDQAGDSKLGLRMVSLEDQLRLLQQQITDIQLTPRSSLGESRTPSDPIGGGSFNDIGPRDLRPSPIIPGPSRLQSYQLYSPPPTYTNSGRSRNSIV